ncbi:hypothetical protein CROQUDRAFT_142496 [Cronartium quercuum f. sp. fusiforme G11]|uniref:Uncharacterized protein n=1 Tax=Cronartium quercuum f. sp. fusiforme G11 TaxID=708437 RepID=A0A9P6TI48_9BASI|nr:hypothetical protein CROQUDRAFT_142496 [Cronartium quercuum f. sp. fusiforme G11]
MESTQTQVPSPPTCFDPSLLFETSSSIVNSIDPALLPNPITKESTNHELLNDIQAVSPPSPKLEHINHLPKQTTISSPRLNPETDSDLDQPVILTTKPKKLNNSKQDHNLIKNHSPKNDDSSKLNSRSNETDQNQININSTFASKNTDLPDYPKVGERFESLDCFKYTCMRASWPRGHQIHIRHSSKYPNAPVTTVFSCNRDRAPPTGDSCGFRVSISSYDGKTDWRVISTQLEHTNHNPQPGDYKPNPKQRDWLSSFALELERKAKAVNESKAQTENPIEIETESDVENQTEDEDEKEIVAIKSDEWIKINTSCVKNRKGQVWAQPTTSKKAMNEKLSDEEEEIEILRNIKKNKRKNS